MYADIQEHLSEVRKNKGGIVGLYDFDGTIVPETDGKIYDEYGQEGLAPTTAREFFQHAASQDITNLIVTGRNVSEPRAILLNPELAVIGGQGLEIGIEPGETFIHPDATPLSASQFRAIETFLKDHPGTQFWAKPPGAELPAGGVLDFRASSKSDAENFMQGG